MDDASVYMCFPCYQEFDSLEAVLAHQLTCDPEGAESGAPRLRDENQVKEQAGCTVLNPHDSEGQDHPQEPSSLQNPALETEYILGPGVQIRYQCGDCGCLFDTLLLWQQHRKRGDCQRAAVDPGRDAAEGQDRMGEAAADEKGEEAPAESGTELHRELRDGGTAVRRDHSYLPAHQGTLELQEQNEAEQVETQIEPHVVGSASEMELTDSQNGQDVGEECNLSSRTRGSRRGKAGVTALSNQSLLCVDCGCGFSLVSELVAHRKTHHGLEGALHRCNVCGESFLNTTLFLYHRRQHRKREHKEEGQEVAGLGQEQEVAGLGQEQEVAGLGQGQREAAGGSGSVDSTEELKTGGEQDMLGPKKVGQLQEAEARTSVRDLTLNGCAATSNPSILCVTCGSAVSTEHELVEHRKTQHALGEVLHRCPECGVGFTNTTLFLYHRRQHRDRARGGNRETGGGQSSPNGASVAPLDGAKLWKKQRVENGREEVDGIGDATGSSAALKKSSALSKLPPGSLPAPASLYRDWSRTPLPHACPYCELTFTRRCLLRAHVFSHTGEKLFSCKLCGKAFSCPSNLMRHGRTHLGAKSYSCQLCGKAFSQAGTLKRHQATHSRTDSCVPRPHPCPDCPSSFQTRAQLQRHRLHHAGNQFTCSTCSQSFKRKKHLDLHSLTHHEKEPKGCPHCSAQFLSQAVLNVHMRRCSGEDDRARGRGRGQGRGRSVGQMECDMCGHCCVTQEGLDLHRLSHTGQTPLRCPLSPCRRRFATSAALEEHVLAHCRRLALKGPNTTPRPFRCEHCGKAFAYASTFRLHMRTHTGERPYECSQCGKCFRQLPHLQDHERIHSGERPFVCWVCGKSFSVAARLTEHARTHSGEKPYACTLCPRTFRSRSNLDKHRKVHGETSTVVKAGEGEGEAAVRTILLVQTTTPVVPAQDRPTGQSQDEASFAGTASSVVLLHPSVSVVDGQDIQHAIEFIIE